MGHPKPISYGDRWRNFTVGEIGERMDKAGGDGVGPDVARRPRASSKGPELQGGPGEVAALFPQCPMTQGDCPVSGG